MALQISIAKDFNKIPGPRYESEGSHSGEQFRIRHLYPKFLQAMNQSTELIVNLDGTQGLGTSFLEEAFGGLVRELEKNNGPAKATKMVLSTIRIVSNEEPYLRADIMDYIRNATHENETA